MRKFADVAIEWRGQKYVVRANRIMPLIARLEGIITFKELMEFGQRQTVPQAKLAMAFTQVLDYVGVTITEEEVYLEMFPSVEDPNGYAIRVNNAIVGLMTLMLPPDKVIKTVEASGNGDAPGIPGA